MLAKQQHWIPRFYLEYFAAARSKGGQPQVWIFSKKEDGPEAPRLVGVNKICKQRYLHSPRNKGEDHRNEALDTKIGELETTMASVWDRLAHETYLLNAPGVKMGLALFMAVLYLRHPQNLTLQAQLHAALVARFDAAPKDADQIPLISSLTITGKTHNFDTSNWHTWRQASKEDHHRAFAEAIEQEARGLAECFLEKRWSVIVAAQPSFITSDRCVAAHHRERETFGLATPGAVIIFPLSPTHVLVLDDEKLASDRYYVATAVGPVNGLIWRGASEYMISSRPIDDVLGEILASA